MNTEEIIQEIHELLEICDFKRAKKLSKELIRENKVIGFNLLTTVYGHQNKTDKCIQTLLSGLKKFPEEWTLWMRLGNYQSDKDKYENALDSFNKSLNLAGADKDFVNLNLAILFMRWGKPDKATDTIEKVSSGSYDVRKLKVQLSILIGKEDYQKVLDTMANEKIIPLYPPNEENRDLSMIHYYYAFALWNTGNVAKAKESNKLSLMYYRSNSETYWLIREIDNKYSSRNKYFRILLTGDWLGKDDTDKASGFFSSYDIVAETTEEALNFIKAWESAPINKETIVADQIKEIKFNPARNPSGIYQVNGFGIFENEE